MPANNSAFHSTCLLAEGRQEPARPLAAWTGILTALRQGGTSVPRFILLQAVSYYANRQYERALSAADQSLEWARNAGFHDGDYLACAMTARSACEWNLGRSTEGLRTMMEATRLVPQCASPTLQFVTLALAARFCLRLRSGDMAALFARQAWNVFRQRLAGGPPADPFCTRYLYHVAECLVFERGAAHQVRQDTDEILAYMMEHLPQEVAAPRRLMVEFHLARAQMRTTRAQSALDRLAELEPEEAERELWSTARLTAQARLDLERGRPAHALQCAETARYEASLNNRRDMESEAVEVWYQAYQKSRAMVRVDRRAAAASGGGLPLPAYLLPRPAGEL